MSDANNFFRQGVKHLAGGARRTPGAEKPGAAKRKFSVKVNMETHEKITGAAKSAGLSVSDLIRAELRRGVA